MKFLLDTHTFLWYLNGNPSLSKTAKNAIQNPDNYIQISIASLWEIAIKLNLKKLELDVEFGELERQIEILNFEVLNISLDQLNQLSSFDWHHRDPFDHLIISQALVENLTLISKDKQFKHYNDLQVLW